jgi:hypothetical protein
LIGEGKMIKKNIIIFLVAFCATVLLPADEFGEKNDRLQIGEITGTITLLKRNIHKGVLILLNKHEIKKNI